jgi:hypothetical protein
MSEMNQFASAQDAGEKDALELRDQGGVPPALREKDRSLQGRWMKSPTSLHNLKLPADFFNKIGP